MFPLSLHIYFEIAALLTSIVLWRSLKKIRLRWFLPFLFFIVLAELSGRYLSRELKQPNAWIYNFVVPVEYLFYGFLFYIHFNSSIKKKLAFLFLVSFALFAILTNIHKGIYYFNTLFLIIGSFFMIVFALMYLLEEYASSDQEVIWKKPMFWIVAGIFLFNAGEFTYNLLSKFFFTNKMDVSLKMFRSINNKLILILYSSFIIAFLCQRITEVFKKD